MKKILCMIFALLTISTSNVFAITPQEVAKDIESGNDAMVKQYLQEGGNPNIKVGAVPISLYAVTVNNTKALEDLLEAGATVKKDALFNMPPLLMAIQMNNVEAVRLLIEHGADPYEKIAGVPVMSYVQSSNNKEIKDIIYKLSVNKSTDINSDVNNKSTMLIHMDDSALKQAEMEKEKGTTSLQANIKKAYGFLDLRQDMSLSLVTPYSIARKLYHMKDIEYLDVPDSYFKSLLDTRDIVYLVPTYNVALSYSGMPNTFAENVVIRKDGKIYKSLQRATEFIIDSGTEYYAFPIGLFDGRPMEVIMIDPITKKQMIYKIDADTIKTHKWK